MTRRLLHVALLVAVLAVSAHAQQGGVIARLMHYDGDVNVVRGGIPLSLYPELPLFSGDLVRTREGRATLRFSDRSELRLQPQTHLSVSVGMQERSIEVFAGKLWARIQRWREANTRFRTGGTIAAIRGTVIEWWAKPNGEVVVGVAQGSLALTVTLADGSTMTLDLVAGQMTSVPPGGAPGPIVPFSEGDIVAAGGTTASVPDQATDDEIAAAAAAAAAATAAAAAAPSAPPPAPAAPPPAPTDVEIPTQGQYAVQLVHALDIASYLPEFATVEDHMKYLRRLGIAPCDDEWQRDKLIDLNDLLCMAGIDPNDPDAPLTLSLEEMIDSILRNYSELFWLQSRRPQTVSPFAP